MSRASWAAHFMVFAVVLGTIAALTPTPWWPTDRHIYQRVGRELIVPGCTEIHCFRVLVPWIVERLPLPSPLAWRVYAVVCEAAAAVAMAYLVARLGASGRTARQIAWLTALGAGSLYAVFDPHTADPLIHLLAPVLMLSLLAGWVVAAGILGLVGVFAKEFAAVPLVVVAIGRAMDHRWTEARRVFGATAVVIAVWLIWQLMLRSAFGYTSAAGESGSFRLGSYISFWLINLGPRLIVASLAMILGVLWLLWPAGLVWGTRELRQFTFSAIPMILVFCAVQQPDRALWNFAFLFMPAVAVVLERVPGVLGWLLVAAHGLANLRVGAQLVFAPPGRVSLAFAGCIAIACLWAASRSVVRARATA